MALRHRIHDAVKRGNVTDIETLLAGNPDLVNDKGEDEWTPCFRAAYNGRLPLVELLVGHGASVGRDADEWQNTPLHACCINGHQEVAEYLLRHGAPIDENNNVGGWTPLFTASYFGWPELVKLLMDQGADASKADREGKTALDVACIAGYRTGNRPVIQALLQGLPVPATPTVSSPPRHRHAVNGRVISPSAPLSGDASSTGRLHVSGLVQTVSDRTISNPPPFTETPSGSRTYFPWELATMDYARRALDLVQDLLLSLFEPASSDGAVPPLPAPSVPFKPYLDAYDLLHLAVTHHDALQTYLSAHGQGQGVTAEGKGTLYDKLQAVGVVAHRASHRADDVDSLLSSIRSLAEHLGNSHVAREALELSNQFHTHCHSRRERLRFLRVTQRLDDDSGSLSGSWNGLVGGIGLMSQGERGER